MSYKIIVDSCADLSPALLRGGDFIPVPLSIHIGSQVLEDNGSLEQTALLRDHNGAAVRWDCSCLLEQAGFTDSYRKVNPDPVSYPGFTYPAGNADAEKAGLNRLSWAPDADERERIDFIYFQSPDPGFSVKSCIITGPAATVVRNRIVPDDNSCTVFTPEGIWPSDHRGNLAVFRF